MSIISHARPVRPDLARRLRDAMKVILHIGAHRCATTSFQHYLRHNSARLGALGIGVWGPRRTRRGLFSGIQPGPIPIGGRDLSARARGRLRMALALSRERGVRTLIVSDENMIGSMRENLRDETLYAAAGERIARYIAAFDGAVSDVVLGIRSQDHYWSSVAAYGVSRGRRGPRAGSLRRLARQPRGWRDVITDVACASGAARVSVYPFESFCGQPERKLALMTGQPVPTGAARVWLNRSPDTAALADLQDDLPLPVGPAQRWMPFRPADRAALRKAYADDILWLGSGADGLATLMNTNRLPRPGQNGPGADTTRGRSHDYQDRRVAQAR